MRAILPLLVLAALSACGKSDNAPGPGGVTVGEARALDEAAEMLEKQRGPESTAAVASEAPVSKAGASEAGANPS